jgi:hypothetical protein
MSCPVNSTPPDLADGNTANLLSLAAEFGFVGLLRQIKARDPGFARSATRDHEGFLELGANLPDRIKELRE